LKQFKKIFSLTIPLLFEIMMIDQCFTLNEPSDILHEYQTTIIILKSWASGISVIPIKN